MNNIKTYQDLLNAKKALESELVTHRAQIRADVAQLKEDWKPIVALISGIGKVASKIQPLLSIGINLLGSVLIQKILPVRSGKVAVAILPLLSRGFFNLIKRFRNHKPPVASQLKISS